MKKNLEQFRCHPFRTKALTEYYSRMSRPRTKVIMDDNVATMLQAQGYEWEDDPRSIYDPEKLFEALGKYAPGESSEPRIDEHLSSGLALARVCFAKPHDALFLNRLPFTARSIDLVTSNPKGSAGLTAFGSTKAEAQTRAFQRGLETLKGRAPEPCIAFARTQFNGKTRLVWGYPYSETVIEGLFAYPLISELKVRNTPMAFAMTTMTLGTRLRVAAYHKKFGYSIDMSSFDSSISAFLIKQAFMIIRSWFEMDEIEPTTGLTNRELMKHIEKYFMTCSIVMPDGNIYHGRKHGVPSGSYFTQIVDSIVNVIIAGTISSKFNMKVCKREVFVLGDDLLMWSDRDISLDVVANYANSVFGVQFNADKSRKFKRGDSIEYLGRVWTKGVPDLPVEDIISRMIFPERFRKYSKDNDRKKKEVEQLFLSYASAYHSA